MLSVVRYFFGMDMDFVITRVSSLWILTKKSFISNEKSLWFSLNLRFTRSLARLVELEKLQ